MLFSAILTMIRGGSVDLGSVIAQILSTLFIIVFILPLHECAHGWMAVKLGDMTPKYDKRITLNPLASIDPMGALCLLLFGYGWAKPVQVNPRNFRNPKTGMAIVALAGPLSNIIAALIGSIIFVPVALFGGNGIFIGFILTFLSSYIVINISLAAFNLIPLPPLDGSRIVAAFLSDRAMYAYYKYQNIIVMVFFFAMMSGALSTPLNIVEGFIQNVIFFIAKLPYMLLGII